MSVVDIARYLLSGVTDSVSSLVKRLYIRCEVASTRSVC